MNDFLNQVVFDNRVSSYLLVIGSIIFVLLIKRIISRFFAGLLFLLFRRQWKNIDKQQFISLVVPPLEVFLVVFISIIALHKLRFPSRLDVDIYNVTVRQVVHALGTIGLIVTFIWLLLRFIDFIALILEQKANLTPTTADNQLIVFFKDFFKVIIGIIGLVMILHFAFGFRAGNMLTGISIIGAALALALRESIENLIASFIIFFDKPFTTGDQVKVHHVTGHVEKIGLRSTRLRTDNKTFVTVPNKQMVDSILDNHTLRSQHRALLNLHLRPNATSKQLTSFIAEVNTILDRHKILAKTVVLNDITPQAIVILVEFFTDNIPSHEFNEMRQDVNLNILQTMEKMQLEIAAAETRVALTSEPPPK